MNKKTEKTESSRQRSNPKEPETKTVKGESAGDLAILRSTTKETTTRENRSGKKKSEGERSHSKENQIESSTKSDLDTLRQKETSRSTTRATGETSQSIENQIESSTKSDTDALQEKEISKPTTRAAGKNTRLSRTKATNEPTKPVKTKSNRKTRPVKDNEISANKKQTTLTQHFRVRRSERQVQALSKDDWRLTLEKRLLCSDESGLEVRVIEKKGRGVFSTQSFKKGDLVCEYAGDLIDYKEAKIREAKYGTDETIGSYMYFFEYQNKKYCVDATKETGRYGRLLNHSKTSGNVTTQLFPIKGTPHLILVAARDIEANEELLYDYGDRSKSSVESHPWLKV